MELMCLAQGHSTVTLVGKLSFSLTIAVCFTMTLKKTTSFPVSLGSFTSSESLVLFFFFFFKATSVDFLR